MVMIPETERFVEKSLANFARGGFANQLRRLSASNFSKDEMSYAKTSKNPRILSTIVGKSASNFEGMNLGETTTYSCHQLSSPRLHSEGRFG